MFVWALLLVVWMIVIGFSLKKAIAVVDVVFRSELHSSHRTLVQATDALRMRRGGGRKRDRLERVVMDARKRIYGCVVFQQILFLIFLLTAYLSWNQWTHREVVPLQVGSFIALFLNLAAGWRAFESEQARILGEYKSATRSKSDVGSRIELDARSMEAIRARGAPAHATGRIDRHLRFTRREVAIFLRLNLSSLRDEIQENNGDFRLNRSICNASIQRFDKQPRQHAERTSITGQCHMRFVTPLRAWVNRMQAKHREALGGLKPWAVLSAAVNGHDDWSSNGSSYEGGDLWDEVWDELSDVARGSANGIERRGEFRERSRRASRIKLEIPRGPSVDSSGAPRETVTGVLLDTSSTGFAAVVAFSTWRAALRRASLPSPRDPIVVPHVAPQASPEAQATYANLCWLRLRPLRLVPHYLVRGTYPEAQ